MQRDVERGTSQPSFTRKQITIINNKGSSYVLDYFSFTHTLEDVASNPVVQQKIEALEPLSDLVFPTTRRGQPLHQEMVDSLMKANIFVTISPEGSDEIIGFSTLKRSIFKDLKIVHTSTAGISPEHTGGSLSQIARKAVVAEEDPDILYGTTIHPAIYKTYAALARDLGYRIYPQEGVSTPNEIIQFTRTMLHDLSSPEAAEKLDETMVRRNYLSTAPQGEENLPYAGFGFFERDLHIQPTDGVLVLLIKPNLLDQVTSESQ